MEPSKDSSLTPALTASAEARLAEIRADISARLWPVNNWMNSVSFNELMDEMSLLQLGFELRSGITRGDIDTRVGPRDRRAPPAAVPPGETIPNEQRAIPGAAPRGSSPASE